MKTWHEDDFSYRFGDHGPKYICETSDYKIGLVRFGSGQNHKRHVHRIMDEVFYVISGKADFYVNGEKYTAVPGTVIHIEPNEIHYIENPYEEPVKMVLAATKTVMPDKITLDESS